MFTWEHLYWFTRITWDAASQSAMAYLVIACTYWLAFYVIARSRWFHRKIVHRFPAMSDYRRELLYSVMSLAIIGAVTAETWLLSVNLRGRTPVYYDLAQCSYALPWGNDGGWTWFVASIAITIFVHDAYFYWTHRLMHHPRLFRAMHLAHHRSTNPTPFAAYSFSPAEALVQAGIFPLVTFAMPIHIAAFGIFMLWQISFNVAGHCGYEFFPRWFLQTTAGKFLNTPTHHVMHHQHVRTNFSLYFNLWDRMLGTNDARYEGQFALVTSRAAEPRRGATPQPVAPQEPATVPNREAA